MRVVDLGFSRSEGVRFGYPRLDGRGFKASGLRQRLARSLKPWEQDANLRSTPSAAADLP
jgi:hypothetical protein